MESPEQILVIFLSSALAIFLLLGIILLIKIIQIVNALKRIVERAESIADKANDIGNIFRKSAAPLAIGRLFTHLSDVVFRHEKSSKKDKKDA